MNITQKKILNIGNLLSMSEDGYDIVDGLKILNNSDTKKSIQWIDSEIEKYTKAKNKNPNVKSFSIFINKLLDARNIIQLSLLIGGINL